VPESVMPPYAFMLENELTTADIARHLSANNLVGVPYSEDQIANAAADMAAQANPEADTKNLLARYPKAVVGDFDGNPGRLTEMDALVAYLQMLGTLVDYSSYEPQQNER
jgi:cytochrome c oxidase cbb3-type subunit II